MQDLKSLVVQEKIQCSTFCPNRFVIEGKIGTPVVIRAAQHCAGPVSSLSFLRFSLWLTVMHNSDSGIRIDSGISPIFAGIGIRDWNQGISCWNRNQSFEFSRNWNRNQAVPGIMHHWCPITTTNRDTKCPGLTCGINIVKPMFLFKTVGLWSYIMPIDRYSYTL